MNRAEFVRWSLVGLSGTLVAPKRVIAQSPINPKKGDIYHTAESPGRWSDKVGSHLPTISVQKGTEGLLQIQVTNAHPQDDYTHYIVKHQLLDNNFNYLAEQLFDPTQNHSPVSEFTLENYQGSIYALSFCNVHDVWLNSATI